VTIQKKASLTMALLASVLLGGASLAHADSISFDSTNCNSSAGCYGLDWTLTVNSGSFMGGLFDYEAILNVTDDALVAGTPTALISAVDFKASSSVMPDATLTSFPGSSSSWTTSADGLSSGGCGTPGSGFVCSQTVSDPANFVASSSPQTWTWLFNTSDPVSASHIGAKLTDLSNPGKLLSVSATVPEPGTLPLLFMGLAGVLVVGVSRRGYC
jgi:hypothetical protein